ncbi:MAG: substrate-binding and VWA domain-containing protein [Actinomycetes bacterium]
MTGRHSASGLRARGRPRGNLRSSRALRRVALPVLLVALAPLAVVGLVRAQSDCAGQDVEVTAAPSVAPALRAAWAKRGARDGACPSVHVTSSTSAESVAELAKPNVDPPDVWVPDSSQWVQQLRRDTNGENTPVQSAWVSPSIASSPIVVAAPADDADSLSALDGGWSEVLSGETPLAVVDPEQSTAGLLTLATAQDAFGSASGSPTRALVSSLVALSSTVLTGDAEGMAKPRSSTSQPFPASEHAVIEANSGPGPMKVDSVYPSGEGMSLDFPVVQFTPATQHGAHVAAVQEFVSSLYGSPAQRTLRAHGLRNADGDAFSTTVDFDGIAPTAEVRSLPQASDAQVVDAFRVWSAAQRQNRTLMVVDVSGSMADDGGDKIRFAAAAAADVVEYLPDTAQLGMWAFSTNLTGSRPWRELVPLGTVGSPDDADARRQALSTQTDQLSRLTERLGDTGLYRTAWDAFQAVRKDFDPQRYNSVVLVTDGANTLPGMTLDDLLTRLKETRSSSQPLPIFTIAIGPDADTATLKRISAATGGAEYTVDTASDIRDVFLHTVIEAGT